jgi:SAM-dependent methyltransferase
VSTPIPLTIPGTSTPLAAHGDRLEAAADADTGHAAASYPVVHGVPLLFPRDGHSTFPAYLESCRVADLHDPWQVDTLAIDAAGKQAVRDEIAAGSWTVDPVVRRLVLATNGMAYAHQVGKIGAYPIPDFRLPPGAGQRLLDLGCSWGRWCVAASRAGYAVTGIDPSLGALLAAQRVTKQLGAAGQFVCGDARKLPFPDAAFDVVHSYSVLQHLSDDDAIAAWSEAARVLKPGGFAYIQMANIFGVRSLYHLARRGHKARNFEVRYRTPAKLLQMARETVGPAKLEIDCFFGLGLQNADRDLYGGLARGALSTSNALTAVARLAPPLKLAADSLYIRAVKPA